ncbi:MAG: hypothetical protein NTV52_34655 [Acidobacteria bacterium]|nr:hypothetical protein [Acidobacteriota bacterium]
MRKLKEVLRLASLGLSQHQIARSCSLAQSTVHEYVSVARASGVQLPPPADGNDHQIEQALFPQRPTPTGRRKHPEPDWPPILEELQKDSGKNGERATRTGTATAGSAICTGAG